MSAVLGAWSVKGVDEEAKSIAKRAAAEAGITMGAWLEAAVMHVARKGFETSSLSLTKNNPLTSGTMVESAVGDVQEQRLFNTTIRVAPRDLLPSATGTSTGLAAIADSVNQLEAGLQRTIDILEARLVELEDGMRQMRNLLPANRTALPTLTQSEPQIAYYELGQISADYKPLQSMPTGASEFFSTDNLLNLAVIVALGVAAFLAGQRLGFDFFNF
ncbi:MAG: hypothetical protein EYC62_03665 [Alphaproteobacteria bacterium]|nr:MAG: hypothetical protein EYC62_03665 [Alphaproteobacteria bacterium]